MKITSRLLAFIGTTGAVMTALVILSLPAKACPASQDICDLVAQCESGGNWSANTGNGYYGDQQFSHSTWYSYGGGSFAATANRATTSQQIAIAEKVLRAQGWKAWPTCFRKVKVH